MLISVITVNYNNLEGLKKTMQSVFKQTFSDFEYIIIDGNSSDGSALYIEDHQKKIAYWVSETDRGIYHAMNKGIEAATGDYVLFLNSGDTFFSNASLSYFEPYVSAKNQKDILYGNIEVISDHHWIKTYPAKLTISYFLKDTLPHPASLIKRSCFTNFLYDEHLSIVSDWKFFMIGICKKKFSYHYIDKVISSFNEEGISSQLPLVVIKEKNDVLNDAFFWYMAIEKNKESAKRSLKRTLKLIKGTTIAKKSKP